MTAPRYDSRMTTAGDRPRVNQSRSATVGHTAWQSATPIAALIALARVFHWELDPEQVMAVAAAAPPVLAVVKTFAQTFVQTRRDLSDELAELKARLEAID